MRLKNRTNRTFKSPWNGGWSFHVTMVRYGATYQAHQGRCSTPVLPGSPVFKLATDLVPVLSPSPCQTPWKFQLPSCILFDDSYFYIAVKLATAGLRVWEALLAWYQAQVATVSSYFSNMLCPFFIRKLFITKGSSRNREDFIHKFTQISVINYKCVFVYSNQWGLFGLIFYVFHMHRLHIGICTGFMINPKGFT